MTDKFLEAYKKFIDTWGVKMQSVMAIEEMSELTKALCKNKRCCEIAGDKEKALDNLKEEIADVLNMVEQLELVYGVDGIEKIRQEKINRTLKKVEETKIKEKDNSFKRLIVVASNQEYEQIKPLTDIPILKMGIGTSNVIETLKNVDKSTKLINLGYAGSNMISIGSIVKVKNSKSYHPIADFDNNEKIYCLNGDVDCYTSSDFVTSTTIEEPVLFDMELNTICALGFDVESYKVVSDCLCLKQCEEANFTECWKKILKEIKEN